MKTLKVGQAEVYLDFDVWEKHERKRIDIWILDKENPSTDCYLRGRCVESEVKRALDWMIENENKKDFVGYTKIQLEELTKAIAEGVEENGF